MTKSNIIIGIGDIHGFKSVLEDVLLKVAEKYDFNKVTLVFMGDYVDRGDDEFGTLDILLDLEAKYPHFIFLLGNHEQNWLDNNHPKGIAIDQRYLDFFNRCKLFHKANKYSFAHGGVPKPYTQLEDVPKAVLINARDTWHGYRERILVVGHTPQFEVLDAGVCVFIDTGIYIKNWAKLSAVVFDDDNGKIVEIIQSVNTKVSKNE